MEFVFVRVVAAVVVTVAKPVGLDADGGGLAGELAGAAGDVPVLADGVRFVRRLVVLAVVDAVANLGLGYATVVALASEFAVGALGVVAVLLVGPITAIVLVIALPSIENATPIAASVR